jgi:hypothetical protein
VSVEPDLAPPGPVAQCGEQGINPHAARDWFFYDTLGRLPPGAAVWKQVVDLLLGARSWWKLYCGITGDSWMVAGGRWTQHYAGSKRWGAPPKQWAPRVYVWRRVRRFDTEEQARAYETRTIRTGRYIDNIQDNGGNPENPYNRRVRPPSLLKVWAITALVALAVWLMAAVLGYRLVTGGLVDTWPEVKASLTCSGGALIVLRTVLDWQSRSRR